MKEFDFTIPLINNDFTPKTFSTLILINHHVYFWSQKESIRNNYDFLRIPLDLDFMIDTCYFLKQDN